MMLSWLEHNAMQMQRYAVLLFAIGTAWYAAQLTWLAIEPAPDHQAIIASAHSATSHGTPTNPIDNILKYPLFADVEITESNETIVDAPKTQMNLRLVGVFSTGDEEGLAIISANNKDAEVFAVGDAVPGGATLKQVHSDRAILETARGLETLPLEQVTLSAFTSSKPASYKPDQELVPTGNVPQQLSQYRDQFKRNPGRLLRMIDAKPYEESGKMAGFQLNIKQDSPAFDALGLQQGDIVTEINGIKLNNASSGTRALRKLIKANDVNMSIIRNGQSMTIQQTFE